MTAAGPNVFFGEPDFRIGEGVALAQVGKQAGAELLGATAYELQPGSRWGRPPPPPRERGADRRPTLHTLDNAKGRLLRVFERGQGTPVPPDA